MLAILNLRENAMTAEKYYIYLDLLCRQHAAVVQGIKGLRLNDITLCVLSEGNTFYSYTNTNISAY